LQTLDFWLQSLSVTDDGGTITGLAATFGEQSAYGDVIKPGAFAATLAAHQARGTSPAMLYEHDSRVPLGRWTALAETPAGLQVEGRVTNATAKAREVRQLLREGVVSGLSIGFIVPKGGQERGDEGRRTITGLDLFEVSVVATPALPGARVREVRTFSTPREAEEALRDAGFSKMAARAVLAKGWAGLSGEDDGPAAEDLRSAIARIDAATLKLKR
jgi:hypothetical protein